MEEKNQIQPDEKQQSQIEKTQEKKIDIWPMVAVAVIAFFAGILVYSEWIKFKNEEWFVPQSLHRRSPSVSSQLQLKPDTTPEILRDLEMIQIENLDNAFQGIDQDLNSL